MIVPKFITWKFHKETNRCVKLSFETSKLQASKHVDCGTFMNFNVENKNIENYPLLCTTNDN